MKVVSALNAPDVRHEMTLLGGVWVPPAQGKGGINRKTPRKGVCQKGLGVFCTRGVKGELKHGTPCRDPSPPDSEPFGLSHERQSAGQWKWVQKNMKRVRFTVFLPHTRT